MDVFILCVIFANIVFMAVDDPVNPSPSDVRVLINLIGSYFFMAVFAWEALIKIVAMGFVFGKKAYLRDAWNILDFFIVVTGLIDLFAIRVDEQSASGATFDALRPLRLLRPLRALRAIGRFNQLRSIVMMIISCIPMLLNVTSLLSFIFFIFGIIGVQLWQGILRGRCYNHVCFASSASSFKLCSFCSTMIYK